MSVSKGRQIERRPNRFAITWAQIIVKFRVGSIVKRFQIRNALTFQSVCCRKVISFVQTAAPSSLRSLFSWCSRTCFAGSESTSSQTRQITVKHTINPKLAKMSDPAAARENIPVELACPSIRLAPSKYPLQKQDSRIGFEPRWIAKG